MEWTKEQKQVIDLRNCNILVSAAAGSGKTAVLVQRILSRIMDKDHPVSVDEFVIVTFTEAAASQMKERLQRRSRKRWQTIRITSICRDRSCSSRWRRFPRYINSAAA